MATVASSQSISVSGVETPLDVARLKGVGAARYASFCKILAETKDGLLDTEKYPMCAGQALRVPGEPAIKAGCEALSQVDS